MNMKAYKVFNPDWTCRGFKYEIGKEYKIKGKPILCEKGFHACRKVSDCFSYYSFDTRNKVAEVELLGDIVGVEEDKQCTNHIKIVRELSWVEMLELANSGNGNSGNRNSGNCNSGNRNSGNRNSGNCNSGDMNSGNMNSGNCNSGNCNSGNGNSGDWNSGNCNSGNCNSGNCNSGDCNSGNGNSGNGNSGDLNSGNGNSGNWNSGNCNSGIFNTDEQFIRMFNKQTKLKRRDIDIPLFLYFDLTSFISYDYATEGERVKYKNEIETCGGFLRTLSYKEAFSRAWRNASDEERDKVKNLPNFDADIFFEISGIKVS